jgi:hypothetical protein
VGDTWCWTAIERGTKLLVAWHHGRRRWRTAGRSWKLGGALWAASPVHRWLQYLWPTVWHLGQRVDYGQVIRCSATKRGRRGPSIPQAR